MQFTRTGLILCTANYHACVDFYLNTIGLEMMHQYDNEHSKLTCLNLGYGHYLMIETGGHANPMGKSMEENPVWLRFNVKNIETSAKVLTDKGIAVKVRKEVWGTVADFLDPDGNHCSLREEETFG